MAPRAVSTLRKVVTAKEIRSGRFPIPAKVRDQVLPYLAQNTYTSLTMVDENGDSHCVVVKLRGNRTKPEIMSRGGRRFAIRRNLVAGAILVFSRNDLPRHFNVAVLPPCTPLPPSEEPRGLSPTFYPTAVLGICSLSAQTPLLPFPTFSSAASTARTGFALPIITDHPLGMGELPKPSSTTMPLGFGSFLGLNHPLGEPSKPVPMTMNLGLSLSIGSVQPPSPANTPPRFSLSASFEKWHVHPLIPNPEETYTLDHTLAIGTTHHSTTAPPTLELSLSSGYNIVATPEITTPNKIKSEAKEVEWYPNLSLSLESNFLHGLEFTGKLVEKESNMKPPEAPYLNAAYLAAGHEHDLQKPKPPTSRCAAKPRFSVLEPYAPLGLF